MSLSNGKEFTILKTFFVRLILRMFFILFKCVHLNKNG